MLRAAALSLLLSLCACREGAPEELSGLWSTGPAGCGAGMGLEFAEDSIDAVYPGERQILFLNPRYEPQREGSAFKVRIEYDVAPNAPNMVGVLDVERGPDGSLRPVSHRITDTLTGTTRLRVGYDPLALALTVRPCAPNAWNGELRGRTTR
ncbi:MAG: hypothetical protein ABW199_01110 [Caulobacterales bacterium]